MWYFSLLGNLYVIIKIKSFGFFIALLTFNNIPFVDMSEVDIIDIASCFCVARLDEVITFLSKVPKQKNEAISFDYGKIIIETT